MSAPTPFDPEAKLLKIAAKDGHTHQLQAIRILMNREKCRACAARQEDPDDRIDIWGDVTDQEGERLRVLIDELQPRLLEFKQLRAAVVTRIKGKAR